MNVQKMLKKNTNRILLIVLILLILLLVYIYRKPTQEQFDIIINPDTNKWVMIGNEQEWITVPQNTKVFWGSEGKFIEKIVSGKFKLSHGAGGKDPNPGVYKYVYREMNENEKLLANNKYTHMKKRDIKYSHKYKLNFYCTNSDKIIDPSGKTRFLQPTDANDAIQICNQNPECESIQQSGKSKEFYFCKTPKKNYKKSIVGSIIYNKPITTTTKYNRPINTTKYTITYILNGINVTQYLFSLQTEIDLNKLLEQANIPKTKIIYIKCEGEYSPKVIPEEYFLRYTNLEKIEMNKVNVINSKALKKLKKLHTAIFPELLELKREVFRESEKLTTINSPKLTSIKKQVFWLCTALTNVDFPELTRLDKHAFYNSGLKEVNFPKLTNVMNYIFFGCKALNRVILPEVTNIYSYAFQRCYNLTEVIFPKIKTIYHNAFLNCNNLKSITIGTLFNNIHKEGFKRCSSLKEIKIECSDSSITQPIIENIKSLILEDKQLKNNSVKFISGGIVGCGSSRLGCPEVEPTKLTDNCSRLSETLEFIKQGKEAGKISDNNYKFYISKAQKFYNQCIDEKDNAEKFDKKFIDVNFDNVLETFKKEISELYKKNPWNLNCKFKHYFEDLMNIFPKRKWGYWGEKDTVPTLKTKEDYNLAKSEWDTQNKILDMRRTNSWPDKFVTRTWPDIKYKNDILIKIKEYENSYQATITPTFLSSFPPKTLEPQIYTSPEPQNYTSPEPQIYTTITEAPMTFISALELQIKQVNKQLVFFKQISERDKREKREKRERDRLDKLHKTKDLYTEAKTDSDKWEIELNFINSENQTIVYKSKKYKNWLKNRKEEIEILKEDMNPQYIIQ
jgi:hypothetical protein